MGPCVKIFKDVSWLTFPQRTWGITAALIETFSKISVSIGCTVSERIVRRF
jgi:hypothetical protein